MNVFYLIEQALWSMLWWQVQDLPSGTACRAIFPITQTFSQEGNTKGTEDKFFKIWYQCEYVSAPRPSKSSINMTALRYVYLLNRQVMLHRSGKMIWLQFPEPTRHIFFLVSWNQVKHLLESISFSVTPSTHLSFCCCCCMLLLLMYYAIP